MCIRDRLYTLIIGIGISAIFIGFGVLDIFMMAGVFGDLADALKNFSEMLKIMGIDVVNIIINIVAGIISFLITFFFLISLAYFAITLSSTALQNKKIKGFISVVLFCVLAVSYTHLDVIALTKDANTPLVLPNTLVELSLASETFASDCVLPKSSSPVITAPIARCV